MSLSDLRSTAAVPQDPSAVLGDDAVWTSKEAAAVVRRSEATLERWRRLGIGPKHIVINGRVLYPIGSVRAFLSRSAAA
jgi:hypothetical protein